MACDRQSRGQDVGGIDIVAELCRLQLEARRLGCGIRVTDASDELRELIRFSGLGHVLLGDDGWEIKQSEDARIDEIVDRGDVTS